MRPKSKPKASRSAYARAGRKSTQAEVAKRVNEVLKLRLSGAEFHDLRDYALAPKQAWNISDGQLRRYIARADALCRTYFDARAGYLLSRHLLQRRTLYSHALEARDYRTALAVLQDEAKLEALYPPTKIAPTNPAGDKAYAAEWTDAERAAALARLYARLGAGDGATATDRTADAE
jgi:hypothetical protein